LNTGSYQEGVDAYRLFFSNLDVNDPEMIEMGDQLQRLIASFDISDKSSVAWMDAMDVIEDIEWNGYQSLIYKSISPEMVGSSEVDKVVGLLMRELGVASELNEMRQLLGQADLPDSQRSGVSNLVKRVLGFWGVASDSDAPVHTSLDQLYESIKFEEYKVSLETVEPRRRMLVELMDSLGVPKSARLLDLGSGTGWMTNALRESGYSQAHGIDYSRRHVQVAQEAYGNYYAQGDWYKLAEEVMRSEALPDQIDVILSMGRSLPHTEDEEHFLQVLDQVRETLDDDGLFIFDMPDPEVGSYQANVQAYRKVLEGFGYTSEELADTWMVVDSPDGKNFFNRYTPPINVVKELLAARGFELIELKVEGVVEGEQGIIREELPNGKGDANIVYVCRKKKFEHVETKNLGKTSFYYNAS
jgi:SAM-dependent methyltransferase